MNSKDRKIVIISIVVSIFLHLAILILLQEKYLFGSTVVQQPEPPKPLELVFEQPQPPQEQQQPERFYELVENPNASGEKPDAAGMLSTEASRSSAPKITDQNLHAIPGSETENTRRQQSAEQAQQSPEVLNAIQNAMLAYRSSHSFTRSALTGQEEKPPEKTKSEDTKGETQKTPPGFRADLVGDFALSTYSWEWAPYWLAFKRKLNRVWFAPPAYYQLGLIHGYTIVRFKVSRDGQLFDFRVLRHVGHESLKESSINAIRASFPFMPLPDNFPDNYLEVTIKMVYPDLRQYNAANN